MGVPILSTFFRPILTVTTVWNTGETGDINRTVTVDHCTILVEYFEICWYIFLIPSVC